VGHVLAAIKKTNMFRYLFKRDTFFATIAVFVVIGLLALLPLNTHVLDPFKLALHDFDYDDIGFAQSKKSDKDTLAKDIVVIDIDTANRADLARCLAQVAGMHPKAIGLDVIFEGPKDSLNDAILGGTMSSIPNLVIAYSLDEKLHGFEAHDFFLNTQAVNKGYVNFVGEDGGVIRFNNPIVHEETHTYYSFAAALARIIDPAAFAKLEKRGHENEIINYRNGREQFFVIDAVDLSELDTALLRDKIVLIGEVSDDPNNIEDKHFTPRNSRFVGKSIPDMNGILVHANILQMVLDGAYIGRSPNWVNWLVAVVLCWLMTAFFIRMYLDKHLWFHLSAKCAQLVFAIAFLYIGRVLFLKAHYKVDLTLTLVAVILVVDVLYFYEAARIWMHRKFKLQTIFNRQHH
jgi:CHASE2 domain-containing sensor protein